MKDILDNKSLKVTPYDVPDGYFENLQKSICEKTGSTSARRWPTYAAIAASFALLLAAGGWIFSNTANAGFSQEDYIVFSDDMTNTVLLEESELYAEAATEDDIIEYLIYTGTEIEELY